MLHNWADELTEEEAERLAKFREKDAPKPISATTTVGWL